MNACTLIKLIESLGNNELETSEVVVSCYDTKADCHYDVEITGIKIRNGTIKILVD